MDFETEEALAAWLASHEVDISGWGRNGHKSIGNLFAEIHRGESRLQGEPPRRLVEVVKILISRGERYLIEAGQDFVNGEYRELERLPSEKMKPGEEIRQVALRCLEEELDVSRERVRLKAQRYRPEQREAASASYPGLLTRYIFHYVEAEVEGLPNGDFSTLEKAGGPGDPVHRHYWRWSVAAVHES